MKKVLTTSLLFIVLLSGCSSQVNHANDKSQNNDGKYLSISGETTRTKDGYILNEYILTFDAVNKYYKNQSNELSSEVSDNNNIVVTGEIIERAMPCETPEGEILQCRAGVNKYIENIQEIKIIK